MTAPQHSAKGSKPLVRTRTPRPDELSREAFEFIAAVDDYKRRHLRSFLNDEEILLVMRALGYRRSGVADSARDAPEQGPPAAELAAFADARERYRREEGRLFPSWSELFDLLAELGYRRRDDSAA